MVNSGIYLLTNHEDFKLLYDKLSILAETTYVPEQNNCAVELLQYRRKHIQDKKEQRTEIEKLIPFCNRHGITLVINDDVELACEYDVGVHLGQGDGSLVDARKKLGTSNIIGRTCHQSIDLAEQAQQESANYVAFGAFRQSRNKPNAQLIAQSLLEHASKRLTTDICVIGGVTVADLPLLKEQGIRYFAMIDALLVGSLHQVQDRAEIIKHWHRQLLSC